MEKCPYCKEEIQETAIKCRFCGEWLKKDACESIPKIVDNDNLSKNAISAPSLSLTEIKLWQIIIYVLVIPISIILADSILGMGLRKLSEESATFARIIGYSLYFSLGIGVSQFTFRLRRVFLVLGISVVNLFLFRFLLLIVLVKTDLVNQTVIYPAIYGTAIEAAVIFATAIVFSFLVRFVEPKFTFAEIHNIVKDVRDHETKKMYDVGVCGRCGKSTKIAKERFIGTTFGKSERHFCDNCGIFLRDNPFKAMLWGLTEFVVTLTVFLGAIASTTGTSSNTQNVWFLILFLGMADGARRLFAGTIGMIKSRKRHLDKTVL